MDVLPEERERHGAPGRTTDEPVGIVAHQVLSELTHTPGSPFEGWTFDAIRNGEYSITTTIDPKIEAILTRAAHGTADRSPMSGQPSNLQAAAVVIEPGTGRVLAYYGGPEAYGADYAGVYRGDDGQLAGFGAHPPGGSFLVYTLAAALRAGHSLDSRWQWTPHEQVGRDPANPVRNTGICWSSPDGRTCTLRDALIYSLAVPFYDVTVAVGVPALLTMVRDLGITALWSDGGVRVDLTTADLSDTEGKFGFEAGIGQNWVTVVDQATAMVRLLLTPEALEISAQTLEQSDRVRSVMRRFWEPILEPIEAAGRLRADLDETVEWLSLQHFVLLSRPSFLAGDDERARRLLRTFLVPAVLRPADGS